MQLTLPVTPFQSDYDCDLVHDDVHAACDKVFAAFCNRSLLSTELLDDWRVNHTLLGLDAHKGVANWAYHRFSLFAVRRMETDLRFLIELGAHEWACSAVTGGDALDAVVQMGHIRGVTLLLDAGLVPNAVDNTQRTALHYATDAGRCRIADILLQRGADVNAHMDQGLTALHLVAMHETKSSLHLIPLLVRRGADVKATDKDGHTARDMARRCFCPTAADLLRRLGG